MKKATPTSPTTSVTPKAPDRLLTLMQLARRWGWSRSKLWRLVATKQIPHLRIGSRKGGDVHFEEAAIERWLAERRIGGGDAAPAPPRPSRSFAEEYGLSKEDAEMFS